MIIRLTAKDAAARAAIQMPRRFDPNSAQSTGGQKI